MSVTMAARMESRSYEGYKAALRRAGCHDRFYPVPMISPSPKKRLLSFLLLAPAIFLAGAALAPEAHGQPQGKAPKARPTQVHVTTLASGLNHPWSLAFLPNGDMLVTERVGKLRI